MNEHVLTITTLDRITYRGASVRQPHRLEISASNHLGCALTFHASIDDAANYHIGDTIIITIGDTDD